MWLKRITPFRIVVVLFVGYQLVSFIGEPSNFSSIGGSAWGGVAIIAAVFWGTLVMGVDVLMQRLVADGRIIWGLQLLAISAMYLFLDW